MACVSGAAVAVVDGVVANGASAAGFATEVRESEPPGSSAVK